MIYVIGDLQGCCDALDKLLTKIDFSPSRDHLFALGDLVNRGPQSHQTLKRLRGLGTSATCLLGNHDLHCLAVASGVKRAHRSDTLSAILEAPDREENLAWLRQCRMAVSAHGWLMVHAGVVPQWDAATTLQLAREVERQLQGNDLFEFLQVMYGNQPRRWSDHLTGFERLRFAVNVLTRIRFVTADGTLDFEAKEAADAAPEGCTPWFDTAGRLTLGTPIAFGHWSTLGLINRPDLLAIDTGCVWGGQLTAVRIDGGRREVIQVQCEQAQKPG